jgi:NADH:ubiquinone oxidoreductase subunit K
MLGSMAYAIVAALLFGLGVFGALARKHAVAVLISIELMLTAVALNFVSFSRLHPVQEGLSGQVAGQAFAIFIIAVAAAETIVALALVLSLYRTLKTASLEKFSILKW